MCMMRRIIIGYLPQEEHTQEYADPQAPSSKETNPLSQQGTSPGAFHQMSLIFSFAN
jgi:hypothetical protein